MPAYTPEPGWIVPDPNANGDIFEVDPGGVPLLRKSTMEQIYKTAEGTVRMLEEMVDALREENARLAEENLQLRSELTLLKK